MGISGKISGLKQGIKMTIFVLNVPQVRVVQ